MKSLLHTLQSNESVLLMYLFNELPAEDRAEVEAMLSTDAGLRKELEQLAVMHDAVDGMLQSADESIKSARSDAAVRRQVYKTIDQWNARQVLAPEPVPVRQRSRLWLVAYSSGIAAALLLGYVFYWGLKSDSGSSSMPSIATNQWSIQNEELANSFDTEAQETDRAAADMHLAVDSDLLRRSLDVSEEMLTDSLKHVDLAAAEREIGAVIQLSDLRTIGGDVDFSNDLIQ